MTDNPQTESELPNPQTQYDSPWKDILEQYFEDFMLFFFPQEHQEIDWSRKPEFLDKELLAIVRDAKLGTRFADKLVKIYRLNGEEDWILIHIEVQSQEETDFPKRLYIYNTRIFNKYDKFVVSVAVLGDSAINWRPSQYSKQVFRCSVNFQFPVIKLLDYEQRLPELETSKNPFATVVMAHLLAKATTSNRTERKQQKLVLVKRLYDLGFKRQDVLNLFYFIDWMMTLPDNLEQEFWQEYTSFEESKRMKYVTSVEKIGIRKGLLEGIALGLKLKFSSMRSELLNEISEIYDIEQLRAILSALETAQTVEELRQVYQPITE